MEFNEYKNAEYWQQQRIAATKEKSYSIAAAVIVTVMFVLFPYLYSIAAFLDG